MKYLNLFLSLLLLLNNCGDNNYSVDSGVDELSDTRPDDTSSEDISPNRIDWAIIVTTDYSTGNYRRLNLDQWSISDDLGIIHSDSVVRCFKDRAFIIHRFGSGSLSYIEGDPPQIVNQFSIGAEKNPQDLVLDQDDTLWVVYFDDNRIRHFSIDGQELESPYDLSEFADQDGKVEAEAIYKYGGRLFVAIQLIDTESSWSPVANGKVIVLDEDGVEDVIELPGMNPITRFKEYKGKLYIGFTGNYYIYGDEGIVEIDPESLSLRVLVSGETLQGDINDFVIYNDELVYILVSKGEQDQLLQYFIKDNVLETLYTAFQGYSLVHIERWGEYLLIADRYGENPGILVWGGSEDFEYDQIFDTPIATGLPPFDLCIYSSGD